MKFYLLSLLVVLFANLGHAAPSSQEVPYYGEKFYHDLSSGTSDEDLKYDIKEVLRSYHLRVNGSYDQIVKSCGGSNCYAQTSLGYNGARVHLMGHYYLVEDHGSYGVRDLYCDSVKMADEFKGKAGPGPDKLPDANVINVEHTWPQSKFSGKFDRGTQKADLHHLFPTDSKANSIRGNYKFGEVAKDTKVVPCGASRFGVSTDGEKDVFEPPQNHKGNVARALFYFALRYDMVIDAKQEAFLKKWAKEDPIDEDEMNRNDDIYNTQGNRNPFIDVPGLEDRISDF